MPTDTTAQDDGATYSPHHGHDDYWANNLARKEQDEAFCDALADAWRKGLEHPPMIGVDTRPGTQHPRLIAPRAPRGPHDR